MSVRVMSQLWRESKAKGSSLLVLLAIADIADDDGVAWPGVETVARKARLTVRHAQRLIRELCESGELKIQVGQGPHGTHIYKVTCCQGDKMSGVSTESAETAIGTPAFVVPPTTGDKMSGVTCEDVRGDMHVTGGVTCMSPNSSVTHHDSLKPPKPPNENLKDEFERGFWKPFPARGPTKLYKPKAWDLYQAMKPSDRLLLHPAVKRYARLCRDMDRQPVDPHRFIKNRNGELWREFIEPPSAAKPTARTIPALTGRKTATYEPPGEIPVEARNRLSKIMGRQFGAVTA